ncbi:YhjD/YihY/BrkB family envelope integrity protein [Candidatus Halobeggiatoa sp. HSG11]|nr:YhjD/YihY/BrkB family envelope integrity protein [Candidatus Halobeggiatoa sp. HSG11]
MKNTLEKIEDFFWESNLRSLPFWRSVSARIFRTIYVVVRDVNQGNLSLNAMSLVYTTLLSIVPLLAVSFSMLKGLGVHNQIKPLLQNILAPLGEKGVEITEKIIGFVENVNVGVLGILGMSILIYTIVALIYKIEKVFNFIWRIDKNRPFVRRFSDYLSVIFIGPLLLFLAIGTTASVMTSPFVQKLSDISYFSIIVDSTTQSMPYIFIIGAFTFLYILIPNVRVRFTSAFIGALVAGFLWQTIGWGFAYFVVSSTQYATIYSGFAILIVFMIWLYLAWLILLIGSSIAFYHQHPEYLNIRKREQTLSNRLKEHLALSSLYVITQHHFQGKPAWNGNGLAQHLGIPTKVLSVVLDILKNNGLLIKAGTNEELYVLAKAPETIAIKEVLDTIRSAEEDKYFNLQTLRFNDKVTELMAVADNNTEQVLKKCTLKDLLLKDSLF